MQETPDDKVNKRLRDAVEINLMQKGFGVLLDEKNEKEIQRFFKSITCISAPRKIADSSYGQEYEVRVRAKEKDGISLTMYHSRSITTIDAVGGVVGGVAGGIHWAKALIFRRYPSKEMYYYQLSFRAYAGIGAFVGGFFGILGGPIGIAIGAGIGAGAGAGFGFLGGAARGISRARGTGYRGRFEVRITAAEIFAFLSMSNGCTTKDGRVEITIVV